MMKCCVLRMQVNSVMECRGNKRLHTDTLSTTTSDFNMSVKFFSVLIWTHSPTFLFLWDHVHIAVVLQTILLYLDTITAGYQDIITANKVLFISKANVSSVLAYFKAWCTVRLPDIALSGMSKHRCVRQLSLDFVRAPPESAYPDYTH